MSGFNSGLDLSGRKRDERLKCWKRFTKMPFEIVEKLATICGKRF
jgi:hypothetical protein